MDLREELFQPWPVRIYRADWSGLYLYLRPCSGCSLRSGSLVTGNFIGRKGRQLKTSRLGGSIR